MINSTFGGFMTARQGMAASQHGLNLTGHNLTNSATEGYTRQRIDQVSLNFNGTYRYASQYNVNVGNGVLVTGTSQLRDPFLDLRYRNEVAHVGEQEVKYEVLGDLQNILDEVRNMGEDTLGNGGIFNQLGDILAKLQQLSNEVGNKEFDTMVRSSCQALTTLFQDYDKRIQEVEDNLAYDLENVDVPQVNKILESIRDLNKTIKSNEIMGDSALELKDQRNLLIDELSQYMKINVLYKPVKVSDSTTVDELTISMVGSDGKKYALVADEQMKQLELEKQGDDWNIGLSTFDPEEDIETQTALKSAQEAYDKAFAAANSDTLKDNYDTAAAALQTEINALNTLKTELTAKEAAANTASDTVAEIQNKITELKATLSSDTATDADKEQAKADLATKEGELTTAKSALKDAKQAVEDQNAAIKTQQSKYNKAEKTYNAAVEALPTDPADANVTDTTNLATGEALVGGNGAADALQAADKKLETAKAAAEKAEEDAEAIPSINDLLVDGSLKGTLEMLNYAGEYDNDNPNNIRGIGYFHNMLDTLANKFANVMNEANIAAGGKDLFETTDGSNIIDAGNICIAKGWANNEYGIAPSAQGANASSGSNDNILHMISLFGTKMDFTTDGTDAGTTIFNGTFEEFFTNIGNVLGLDIQSTTEKLDNYSQLASTLEATREGVTGVSLDEEAMNIMRYQQSYNASARLMTALDEMLGTLISNTGVVGR